MRRFIFSLLIISLTATLTFATSKPSLDGRAVVADEGVLPPGLFAKTVGYLPGDSVSVTNPATGITINVLILGSIDPSAGVAILLSPEAADKLFINPDSNTQVKITKRTGMLDEAGSGTGTIVADTPTDTLLPNQMKNQLESQLHSLDETLGTGTTLSTEADQALASPPEPVLAELVLEPVEATPEVVATETAVENQTSDYAVTSVEEVPMNHVLAEHDPVYIVESLSEDPFAGFETEPEVATTTEEEQIDESPVAELLEPEVVEETQDTLVHNPAESEMEGSDKWPSNEDTLFADEYLAADDTLVDPFSPIILVPAEKNPPADEIPALTEIPSAESSFVPEPVKSAIVEHEVPYTTLGTPAQQHMIKALSQLESGKYYVQVATFAEQDNIDKLLKEYGNKYPFIMVPLKSGMAMQMMVGPLNVDEYGVVLARFKNLGFKDSFLRKIR